MSFTAMWYCFIALLVTDTAVIYFIALRYLRDNACVKLSLAIMSEFVISLACGVALYYIPFASDLRWAPFIAVFLHIADNLFTVISLLVNIKKNLKADFNKNIRLRGIFPFAVLTYKEGAYASYKKQYFLAVFLKLTVIFSSVVVLCYAFSSFVFFKTL